MVDKSNKKGQVRTLNKVRRNKLADMVYAILSERQDDLSVKTSIILQPLEPRMMFDGAAVETVNLADGVSDEEQSSVLDAVNSNEQADASESLLEAIKADALIQETDYSVYQEVVIIDSKVKDPHTLIKNISRKAAVEVIHLDENGVEAIASILSKYNDLEAVHIISHGDQAELRLGDMILNSNNLSDYVTELSQWGQSISTNGDILFYGCKVAQGEAGLSFVEALKSYTDVDIAASTDDTGSEALGGDSYLEYNLDVDVSEVLTFEGYSHLLEAPAISGPADLTYDVAAGGFQNFGSASITGGGESDYNGGSLTIEIIADYNIGEDWLSIENQGTGSGQIALVSVNNNNDVEVRYENVRIGIVDLNNDGFDGDYDPKLVINFDQTTSEAAVNALMSAITYQNGSPYPTGSSRTVSFTLEGPTTGVSNTENVNIDLSVNLTLALNDTGDNLLDYDEAAGGAQILDPFAVTTGGEMFFFTIDDYRVANVNNDPDNPDTIQASGIYFQKNTREKNYDRIFRYDVATGEISVVLDMSKAFGPDNGYNGSTQIRDLTYLSNGDIIFHFYGTVGSTYEQPNGDAFLVSPGQIVLYDASEGSLSYYYPNDYVKAGGIFLNHATSFGVENYGDAYFYAKGTGAIEFFDYSAYYPALNDGSDIGVIVAVLEGKTLPNSGGLKIQDDSISGLHVLDATRGAEKFYFTDYRNAAEDNVYLYDVATDTITATSFYNLTADRSTQGPFSLSYLEGASVNYDGWLLNVSITDGRIALEDQLSVITNGSVTVSGTGVYYDNGSGDVLIGTITSNGTLTNDLEITFNSFATNDSVQAVASAITYENTSTNPITGDRTVSFTLKHPTDNAQDSNTETVVVTVESNVSHTLDGLNDNTVSYNLGGGAVVVSPFNVASGGETFLFVDASIDGNAIMRYDVALDAANPASATSELLDFSELFGILGQENATWDISDFTFFNNGDIVFASTSSITLDPQGDDVGDTGDDITFAANQLIFYDASELTLSIFSEQNAASTAVLASASAYHHVSQTSGDFYYQTGSDIYLYDYDLDTSTLKASGVTSLSLPPENTETFGSNFSGLYAIDDDSFYAISSGTIGTYAINGTVITREGTPREFSSSDAVIGMDALSYFENSDASAFDFNGGNLTIAITSGGVIGEDVLSIENQGTGLGQISVAGSIVSYTDETGTTNAIGTYIGGTSGADLVITFNAATSKAAAQALASAITYNNSSLTPTSGSRELSFTLNHATEGASNTEVVVVSVNTLTIDSTGDNVLNYTESSGPQILDPFDITDSDGTDYHGSSLTVSISSGRSDLEDLLGVDSQGTGVGEISTDGISIVYYEGNQIGTYTGGSGADDLVISFDDGASGATGVSEIAVEALMSAITYENTSETPDVNDRIVSFQLSHPTEGLSNVETVTITVTSVNDAPVAIDSSISTNEDLAYTFSAGDFGFSDVDGDSLVSIKITDLSGFTGTLKLNGTTVSTNDVISVSNINNNELVFTPNLDTYGKPYTSFSFSVNDGTDDSDLPNAVMTINVEEINLSFIEQAGSDILGQVSGDQSGYDVAISEDGNIIAVSAPFSSSSAGEVRLYEMVGGSWTLKGNPILGDLAGDESGTSVSLSADGLIVAIGSPGSDSVQVYTWNGGIDDWTDHGVALSGDEVGASFGQTVTLSADGLVLAVGEPSEDLGGTDRGSVKIYDWVTDVWVSRATIDADIDGTIDNGQLGSSLALNQDGSILAVGGVNDQVDIYSWNGSAWSLMSSGNITGTSGTNFGHSIAMNYDGSRVAIGAYETDVNGTNSGSVSVYDYDGSWSIVGTIDGIEQGDEFGFDVSLSADGNRLIVSADINASATAGDPDAPHQNDHGRIQLYDWNDTDNLWVQSGEYIAGEQQGEQSGYALALSKDGRRVVIGAPFNDTTDTDAGVARVYDLELTTVDQSYTIGGPAVILHDNFAIADSNDQYVESVTVSIRGFTNGDADILNYTNISDTLGVTIGYDNTTGVLTMTSDVAETITRAHYQSFLSTITYETTSSDITTRNIDFVFNDGTSDSNTITTELAIVNSTPSATDDTGYNVTAGDTLTIDASGLLDNDSSTPTGETLTITDYSDTAEAGSLIDSSTFAFGEFGQVEVGTTGVTVNLANTYTNAVVFAFVNSRNDLDPVIARVDSVGTDSFNLRLVEPLNSIDSDPDYTHTAETVSYMVFEVGTYTLADGTKIEVGTTDTSQSSVNFTTFTLSPYVISQVQSDVSNDASSAFLTTRHSNINNSSFDFTVDNYESFVGGPTSQETVGYFAIDSASGNIDGYTFNAGSIASVTQAEATGSFSGFTAGETINFFGQIASSNDSDPAEVRVSNLDSDSVTLYVEEDQSSDAEVAHVGETIHFFAIEGASSALGGNVTYDPGTAFDYLALGETAEDTFTYTVTDNSGDTDTATVTVTVTGINEAPTAASNDITTQEDAAYIFTLADFNFSDIDTTDRLSSVEITSLETFGSLTINGVDVELGSNNNISRSDIIDGLLVFTPAADANGEPYASFSFKVSDDSGAANAQSVDSSVMNIHVLDTQFDPPVNTVPLIAQSVNEETDLTFTNGGGNAISVTDADGNLSHVELSVTNGTLSVTEDVSDGVSVSYGTGNKSITITADTVGDQGAINAILQTLVYHGDENFTGNDQLVVKSTDTTSPTPLTDTDIVRITVNQVDDAPVNKLLDVDIDTIGSPSITIDYQGVDQLIGNFSVTDVDNNLTEVIVSVYLSNGTSLDTGASLRVSEITGVTVTNNNSESVTITGDEDSINLALATLVLNGSNDTAILRIESEDGSLLTDTDNISITISDAPPLGNPPENTVPLTILTPTEETGFAISGVSVEDIDGDLVSTRLVAQHGTITVIEPLGLSGSVTITYNTPSDVTITGSSIATAEADINAVLKTVLYTGDLNYSGLDVITMISTDDDNLTDIDYIYLDVQAVDNDPPVHTILTNSFTTNEDDLLAITGVSVTDPDGNLVSTTVSVGYGTLNVALSGSASLSGPNDSASLTISGTEDEINETLSTLVYTPTANYYGSDTLVIDSIDTASLTDRDEIAITITAIDNDPPVNTLPVDQATYTNATLAIPGISVTDVDGDLVKVVVSVTGGTLNIAPSLSGISTIDGVETNGTSSITITADTVGDEASINSALATLVYSAGSTAGDVVLTVLSTDDQDLTDQDSLTIIVNDEPTGSNPPVNTLPGSFSPVENVQKLIPDLNVTDLDNDVVSVQLSVANGVINISGGSATVANNNSSIVTLSGSHAAIQETLQGFVLYQSNLGYNGQDTLTMYSIDSDDLTDTDQLTFSVTSANSTPSITVESGDLAEITVIENDNSLNISGTLTLTDLDLTDTVSVSVDGTVNTAGDLNTLDNTALFNMFSVQSGDILDATEIQDTFTWSFDSGSETFDYLGSGESLVLTYTVIATDSQLAEDSRTVEITIYGANQPPVNTISPSAYQGDEDTPIDITGLSVDDIDDNLDNVVLEVSSGTLSITDSSDNLSIVSSNGDKVLTISINAGTLVDINAALATVQYQGDLSFNGFDTLVMTATDADGLFDQDNAVITINPINDAPVASDVSVNTDEDNAYTFNETDFTPVGYSDVDGDALASITVVASTIAGNGVLTYNGTEISSDTVILVANIGLLVYTPDAINGEAASFDFSVNDGIADSASAATMTINVSDLNDPPDLRFADFEQIGNDIVGLNAGDQLGQSVVLNQDGSILAVGSRQYDNGADNNTGYVQVYQNSNGSWIELGNPIYGDAGDRASGFDAIALSDDGLTMAIGASGGSVTRIYQYSSVDGDWIPLGSNYEIAGEAGNDSAGYSVSLSADGTTVAIGAVLNDGINGSNSGHVRIYTLIGGTWQQVGDDIDGLAANDNFGNSVSLSADGSRVAIGMKDDNYTNYNGGEVRVFDLTEGTSWQQVGNDINDITVGDVFRYLVDLSADGSRLIVAEDSSDQVQVYDLVGTIWTQVGQSFIAENDAWYDDVAISDDGLRIVISGGTDSGDARIQVYDWDVTSTLWVQYGLNIYATEVDSSIADNVSLSGDGQSVVGGAYYAGVPSSSGVVKAYDLTTYITEKTITYTENDPATTISEEFIITDVDDTNIESATITMASYNGSQDVIGYSDITGITVNDSTPGTLILTGSKLLSVYETFFAGITYKNTSDNPDVTPRVMTFTVNDGDDNSNTITATINIVPVNDAPVLAFAGTATTTYTENSAAITINDGFSITDPDDLNIESATVTIASGTYINGEDSLFYDVTLAASLSLTHDFDLETGVLTFIGSATKAEYETLLATVSYINTSDNPTTTAREVTFKVNDGDDNSNTITAIIDVTAVNDPPDLRFADFEQIGGDIISDITGKAAGDNFGETVVLNDDGSILAIGAGYYDADRGYVGVYQRVGSSWQLLGDYIVGGEGDIFSGQGNAISLSADGMTIAIGAYSNDTNGSNRGQVTIYTYNESTDQWDPLGSENSGDVYANAIYGEANGDRSGFSVSLSSDGTRVAIGANQNDGNSGSNSDNRGHVRVYDLIGGTLWQQVGDDIDGEAAGDRFGESVSLSSDGTRLAIGAVYNDGINGNDSGHVRIYELIGASWQQVGSDIDGAAAGDSFGWSVDLSSDGARVIIGAGSSDEFGFASGEAQVYDLVGTEWVQAGQDINGQIDWDFLGESVSISNDGLTIAVGGMTYNDEWGGFAQIYDWDATNSLWVQRGLDIYGEAYQQIGPGISLSGDGQSVAIGAPYPFSYPPYVSLEGFVRTYDLTAYITEKTITYTENDPAATISEEFIITDVDDTNIESATITMASYNGSQDVIGYSDITGITVDDLTPGTLVLTGSKLLSVYETFFAGITYENTSDNPDVTPRVMTFTVNDGDDNSNTITATINIVSVNDLPTGADNTVSTDEDEAYVFGSGDFTFNDVDGDAFAGIQIVSLEINGTLTFNGLDVTENQTIDASSLAQLIFDPLPNETGAPYDRFTFKVYDGTAYSDEVYTMNINVDPLDDAPINTLPGSVVDANTKTTSIYQNTAQYIEDISVTDPDGDLVSVQVSVDAGSGTLLVADNANVDVSYNLTNDVVTITAVALGDEDSINLALSSLVFNMTSDGATLEVLSTDSGDLTDTDYLVLSNSGSLSGTPPVNTVPLTTLTPTEDTGFAITTLSVTDDNDDLVSTRLTAVHGTITVIEPLGLTSGVVDIIGNGTDDVSLVMTDLETAVAGDVTKQVEEYIQAILKTVLYTPDTDYFGPDIITMVSTDFVGLTDIDYINLDVQAVENDPPVHTILTNSFTTSEDNPLPITGLSVTDPDGNLESTTISVNHGSLNITSSDVTIDNGSNGGSSFRISGTEDEINAALATLVYTPDADYNGTDILMITSVDSESLTDSDAIDITIDSVNEPPINDLPGDQTAYADQALLISGISVSDADSDLYEVTVSIASGTLNVEGNAGVVVVNNASDSVTIRAVTTGDEEAINLALASLTYTGSLVGSHTLTVHSTDYEELVDQDTLTITVEASLSGNAPVNTMPTLLEPVKDTLINISGLDVTDVDSDVVSVELSVFNGVLQVGDGVVTAITTADGDVDISGNGSSLITLTATDAYEAIRTVLASNINYLGNDNYSGADTLTMISTDNTDLSDIDHFAFTITGDPNRSPIADNVSASGPEDAESISITLTGSDPDYGDSIARFRIMSLPSDGLLYSDAALTTLALVGAGVGGGANDYTVTDDTLTLYFVPDANFNGEVTFGYKVIDNSNKFSSESTATITVTPVNDAPVNTVSPNTYQGDEDTPINITGLSVGDVDDNLDNVVLEVSNGTLTSTYIGSVTIDSSNGGKVLTIHSGSLADINAALATVQYQGDADFNGYDVLVMTSTDTGADGDVNTTGDNLFDQDNAVITVVEVNDDPPINTVPGAQMVDEDTALAFNSGNSNLISVTDPDGNLSSTQLQVNNGSLTVSLSGLATISSGANGSGDLTISGTETDINATLATLVYQGNLNFNGSDTLTVTSTDATARTDIDTVDITITAVD
ncbi:DUF4347 domain-containing protein, partial [Thiotrichales bacterium 19S9-12]|nr:DUF4347 domain-containing protein [Thiotrichales bacterium 19S9-12]